MTQATPLRDLEPRREETQLHGRRISYLTAGEGPVLLLIHGIASDSEAWRASLPLLARRATVIAPDLPGHGSSGKGPGDYSLGSLACMLRDLLVKLGHEQATLVGHSLGGGVAMQFAYMFPERTERLVLVSSGGLGRTVNLLLRAATLPGSELAIALTIAPITALGRASMAALRRVGLRAAPDLGEVGRGFATLADGEGRAAFLDTLRSVVNFKGQRIDASDRLYLAAGMPTLVLWGERDPIIPVGHAHRGAAQMPGSRLVTFEDSGHFPQIDDPHRFAATVRAFLDETEPSCLTAEAWNRLLREAPLAAGDGAAAGGELA
ncbi:MAG TPA: alpha/beta fold hydrolase [Solirubrobacteraceae bacterium]|jgi:pimeloyl-ACP methyl ester carboxylesterase|nr:alpha/beta fold hydrolase [Solirubrobacteraceae bacterium]